jgi:transposase
MPKIGVDSHTKTHTAVAVDDVGRRLGVVTTGTNLEGHLALLRWADAFPGAEFALEDCRHLTRRLEGDLLAAGRKVVRVPTRLMADARRGSRVAGKSDPIDAEAVAVAALRHRDLPVAELDGPAREVKLLSDHRRDLVGQRTRVCSQLRWHLHELDPDITVAPRGLRHRKTTDRVAVALARFDGVVARLARTHLARLVELNAQVASLERELRVLVERQAATLLQLPGCGTLSAAVILGETAGVHRFRSKDAFARFTGTAPVPVWSGSSAGKVRLNRGGNRNVNWALHMIAVTQARGVGPGRQYLDKQKTRGKDRTAAFRLLRRQLSDAVFSALKTDAGALHAQTTSPPEGDQSLPAAAALATIAAA